MTGSASTISGGALPACRRIIMVGTHITTMGGISTVVRGYRDAGFFERFECKYVSTHRDGSTLTKAGAALSGLARAIAELVRGGAPLVHIHLSSRASFWRKYLVMLSARVARRPFILHVHGSEFMRFYSAECSPRARRVVRAAFGRAALVLALSEQWRDSLRTISSDVPIEVLPNAVALPDPSAAPATALSPRADESTRVLALGRIGIRKGSFDLLEAFAALAARDTQARLVCAGDGDVAGLRQRAAELGLADRVLTPGWLDRAGTARELASATIFALPSYAEGLPMALLEAMSYALPVLTCPVGGIPQLVRDGGNGRLVPCGDVPALTEALLELADRPDERRRLGAAARETIARGYSIDAHIAHLGEIYARFGITSRGVCASASRATTLGTL